MIPYALIGDEQAYSRAKFRAATLHAMTRNALHCAAERAHGYPCPVSRYELTGLTGVTLFVPVLATGLELLYRVRIELGIEYLSPGNGVIRWSVVSEDTSGGTHSAQTPSQITTSLASPAHRASVGEREAAGQPAIYSWSNPYPSLGEAPQLYEAGIGARIRSGWQVHTPDPSLARRRMIGVELSHEDSDATGWGSSRVYLTEIEIVGYSDGVGVY